MKKCCSDCTPCCDFCRHAIHDEWTNKDGTKMTGGPIGCSLWDDTKHQRIAEMCLYCEDFHCKNIKE